MSENLHPADGASLRCFLVKCSEDKRREFINSEAALLISVGRSYHEDEKFRATVHFVNEEFKKCHIMVNDTLQRHTMILDGGCKMTMEEAYEQSVRAGNEWIERNMKFLRSLSIPYEIHRWDYWLKKEEYSVNRSDIDNFLVNDPDFKKNMDLTINEFLERRQDKVLEVGLEMAYALCLEYLLEESAIIMKMWRGYGYDFLLYPGKIIDVFEYLNFKLSDFGSSYWLHVKFRRNNKRLHKERLL